MTQTLARVRSVTTAIGLTYGSYFVGSAILALVATALAGVGIDLSTQPGVRLVLSTVLLQGVTFGGIGYLYLTTRERDFEVFPFALPSRTDIAVIIGGSVTLLVFLVATSTLLSTLGIESAQNQIVTTGQRAPWAFLLLVVLSFLVVGPGEEFLYRGIIQGSLRETLHPARAIVLASILFGSIHLFSLSGEGKLVYVGITFCLSLFLGAIYEYTENLTVPALAHGAYNAAQFAVLYLSTTGTNLF